MQFRDPSVEERHRNTGKSPTKGLHNDELEHLSWGQAESCGCSAWSTEDSGGISSMNINTWREGAKRTDLGSFPWCSVIWTEAVGTNWIMTESGWTSFFTVRVTWPIGTGCPQRWNPLTLRYPEFVWTWSWTASFRCPCLSGRGLNQMTFRSPFQPQLFCDSVAKGGQTTLVVFTVVQVMELSPRMRWFCVSSLLKNGLFIRFKWYFSKKEN